MIRKTIYLATLFAIMFSCSGNKNMPEVENTDTIPLLVTQIQKCSKLYSAEVKLHKIITHNDIKKLSGSIMQQTFSIDLPLGKRKLAIPMDATIKAYINFSDFSSENINKDGEKLEITLPDPVIVLTSTRIDHKHVKQFVALTRSNFSDEELSKFEKQGRQAIIKEIPGIGITQLSRESAAKILVPMFTQMGYKEENITISFRKKFTIKDISSLIDKTTIENGKERK